jgi:REP element-mobilizing transposase RayT
MSDTQDDYGYDSNGNMTSDANKGITSIDYNYLNLPVKITVNGNGNVGNIVYIYDATGTKMRKIVSTGTTTDYAGNHIYENGQLQFFSHPEGYVTPGGQGGFDYVYQYKDHLGNGAYFITICTQSRGHFFGKINDGKMVLSHVGVVADILWHEIPNHSKYVELGDFVVMPNHIHGILILDTTVGIDANDNADANRDNDNDNAGTLHTMSLPRSSQSESPGNEHMAKISPRSGSISTIIRSYKSAVTKHANRLGLENGWQSRFHDHIIRNDAEYQRISNYIINNPANWKDDKFI